MAPHCRTCVGRQLAGKSVFLFFYAESCHFCQQEKPLSMSWNSSIPRVLPSFGIESEEDPEAFDEFG